MKVYTGDQMGMVKETSLERNAVARVLSNQSREQQVLAMAFADDSEREVAAVLRCKCHPLQIIFGTSSKSLWSCNTETGSSTQVLEDFNANFKGLACRKGYVVAHPVLRPHGR